MSLLCTLQPAILLSNTQYLDPNTLPFHHGTALAPQKHGFFRLDYAMSNKLKLKSSLRRAITEQSIILKGSLLLVSLWKPLSFITGSIAMMARMFHTVLLHMKTLTGIGDISAAIIFSKGHLLHRCLY